MRHLLLATLFLSFIAVAQERPTGVDDASSHLNEADNATLLKTYKLAEPTTGNAQYQKTAPKVLEERVVISTSSQPGNEDRDGFLCPDGTDAACLDIGDQVCPGAAKCVDDRATCFDDYPCGPGEGFVCATQYDDMLSKFRQVAAQHDEIASENVALREKRLEQKNCVINAATLKDAIRCVRKS